MIGAAVLAPVIAGFVTGPAVGIPAWAVALTGDMALIAVTRRLPLRAVPVGLIVLVLAIGALAGAAAHAIDIDHWSVGHSLAAPALAALASGAMANVLDNLPTLLIALPVIDGGGCGTWAVLLGVNAGPALVLFGSLSSLLWASILRSAHVEVTPRHFAVLGATVVLPALAAALVVLTAVAATGAC